MQALGAAVIVTVLLVIVLIISMLILAPTFERIKYYDMQMQLSRERTAHGDNMAMIIVGGLFCLALVVGGGLILFFNHQADVLAYRREVHKLEAELEREQTKLIAYREAVRHQRGGSYAVRLPEEERVHSSY
jgi:uncharacterized integral membrane protein